MQSPALNDDRGLQVIVATPPPRVRITDWAYELLREGIVSGELAPGAHLSVPALARELGVSRSPVREAVQRLIRDGLAVERTHQGATVSVLERADLVEAYRVREVLEGLVARQAAERVDDALRDDLGAILARHAERIAAGDLAGHIVEDMAFHRRLRLATGNQLLAASLENLQARIRLAMHTTSVTAGPGKALGEHRKIAAAVGAGDADAAEARARAHVARLRRNLER